MARSCSRGYPKKVCNKACKKGMQQGMQQGWQQGQRETMEAIAKSMLLLGKYDIEEIAKISGLSIIEIEKYRNKILNINLI